MYKLPDYKPLHTGVYIDGSRPGRDLTTDIDTTAIGASYNERQKCRDKRNAALLNKSNFC
ncbi:hypothetical protein NUBL22009_51960 [Klebsiella pneumoniae]|nr:hypothetical protein NUBL22009_51960 [Klebsiella pneumoniae]